MYLGTSRRDTSQSRGRTIRYSETIYATLARCVWLWLHTWLLFYCISKMHVRYARPSCLPVSATRDRNWKKWCHDRPANETFDMVRVSKTLWLNGIWKTAIYFGNFNEKITISSVNSVGRVLSLQVRSHWFESNTEYLL